MEQNQWRAEPERELSARSAQAIVEEMGTVVRHKLNFMDCRGYVIASTDPDRVGNLHTAARRMIQEGLEELYVTKEEATSFSRQGINLSIYYEGRIAGVIGITGPYEEVAGYAQIVKKMAEILIRETAEGDSRRMRRRVRDSFLEEWILENGLAQPQSLARRGERLGIDISLPRRVLVFGPPKRGGYMLTAEGQRTLEQAGLAAETAAGASALVFASAGRHIILVPRGTEEDMRLLAEKIRRCAEEKTGISMAVGIDGDAQSLHTAWLQADKAWRSVRTEGSQVLSYPSVMLELVTQEVPPDIKEEYIRKLFKTCDDQELCRQMGLLEAYFQEEGSLKQAAQVLHVHKNTLTYKLKKLEELTGYDVRSISQAPVLYMAMVFFQDIRGKMEKERK